MLSLLKNLGAGWEQSRDGLYADLEQIETIINRRWSATFGTTSLLGSSVGGTGTSTIFTKGSVVFAGLGGVYSQNNSKFFWDDTRHSLNITGRGWIVGDGTYSSLILRSGSTIESNDQSALVIARGSNAASSLTFIDAYGAYHTNASINLRGDVAQVGALDANGAFTPMSTAPVAGIASMLQVISDTTVAAVFRSESTPGNYALQVLDSSNKFVLSILGDGSFSFGAGATHASEDTVLARTAAGKLKLTGTTPMLQLGGITSAFPAWKRLSATMACRLADDSGYADLDVPTISPANGFDFSLKQNGILSFQSTQTGAVANTLILQTGFVGIGTVPVALLHAQSGSSNFIASNNSFGNDWIVLTNDTGLSSTKYFLAESSFTGTVLNARSGLIQSFRINNAEQMRLTTTGLGIGATASAVLHLKAGTATASTAPFKFTSGTNLTSAEAGAMEWDGTNLFVTQTSGPTRKTLAYTTDFPYIAASVLEKAETGTDANVLTYTTNASTDEALHVDVMTDVSALTGTSVVVTVTWKDSNNATATATATLSGVSDGTINVPINAFKNTNVVVSTVFTGVSTAYNISAIITRNK